MSNDDFPTKKETKKHWDGQDVSVFRPPYSRDPGVSILNSMSDAQGVLEAELEGAPVGLFRARNPAITFADPMARAQSLIQEHHRAQLSAEDFAAKITSPAEHLLFLIIYGKMTDSQRAGHTVKLAAMLFNEQKRQLDELHREREQENKRTKLLQGARRLQMEMIKRAEAQADAKVDSED